jgi:hypothetical protein
VTVRTAERIDLLIARLWGEAEAILVQRCRQTVTVPQADERGAGQGVGAAAEPLPPLLFQQLPAVAAIMRKGVTSMTVTLNLSWEMVRRLRERAAQCGLSLEDCLQQLVEQSAAAGLGTGAERTAQEWIAEWRSWTASHRALATTADDSRESIYADRGE